MKSRRISAISRRLIVWVVFLWSLPYMYGAFRGLTGYPEPGFWNRVALPLRVVRLTFEPPDTQLAMPVQGARVARVADTWHAPRAPQRLHQGQDIFARRGTRVLSATRGVVVRVGQARLGGNTVLVAGPGGRMYYYAHLDDFAEGLSPGRVVTTESVLGYVGNTGNARGTPPHLHFSVYGPGGAIDPLPILGDRS